MGATFTYLPDDVAEIIYDQMNVSYDNDSALAYAECNNSTSTTIDFEFGGQTISVPQHELILVEYNITNESGVQACPFGILPAGNDISVQLGDTFLRSAYVVHDLDHNEISIAPTVFNATHKDIWEIEIGVSSIPSATTPSSVSSTPTSPVVSSLLPASSAGGSKTGGSNKGAIAGGVVGGIGGLIAVGVIIFFLLRRHRRHHQRGDLSHQGTLHESAQLHSNHLQAQSEELDGAKASRDYREKKWLSTEMPVNEEVRRSDPVEMESDQGIIDEMKAPDTGMKATIW